MRKLLLLLFGMLFLWAGQVNGQWSVDALETDYTIDFETTVSGVNEGTFDGSGFAAVPVSGQLNANAWAVIGMSDGDKNFGVENSSGDFARGSSAGSVTSGGIYAFEVESGNYALGVQPGGSDVTPGYIGLLLTNNTGSLVNTISVSYDVWQFNDMPRGNTFNGEFSIDGTTWFPILDLSFTTTEAASAVPVWEKTALSFSGNIGFDIPHGTSILFRWYTDDDLGSGGRDEIAVDNITVNVSYVLSETFVSLPVFEDFEGGLGNVILVNEAQDNFWMNGPLATQSGNAIYITNNGTVNEYTTASSSVSHAYIPVNFNGVTDATLSFDWICVGEGSRWDYLSVYLMPDTEDILAGTLPSSGSIGEAYYLGQSALQNESIVLGASEITQDQMRLVFSWKNDGGGGTQPPASIDNIALEEITCPSPSMLLANNISGTSANLSWTESGTASAWNLKVASASINPETDAADIFDGPADGNPHAISTLAANTTYFWYVQADCGGEVSGWSEEGVFATPCNSYTVLPSVESFDAWGTGSDAFPDCWTRPVTFGTSPIYPSCVSANSVSTPNSLRFNSYIGIPTYAVTPAFAEDIHNLMVSFQLKREGASSGTIEVGVMSDPNDINTFELVQIITPTSTDWISYEVFFNATTLSGANNSIAFRHVSGANNYYYWLDDVTVDLLPSCIKPVDLLASNVTSTGASLSWTESGTASAWNLKVASTSINPETEAADIFEGPADGNPHAISTLAANTTYYWYVQANCGGDVSEWSVVNTFTTPCEPYTVLPFVESFDAWGTGSNAIPDCWARPVIYDGYTASPSCASTYSLSSPNSLRFQSTTTESSCAATPAFAEDIHGLMVSFSLKASNATTSGTFEVGVMSDQTDIGTFESVQIITPTSTDWQYYEIALNSTLLSGANNYIAFRQVGNTNTYSYFYLEDLMVDLIPSCPRPVDLFADNITSSSARLNWTEPGVASTWNIKVSTLSAFVPTEIGEIFDGAATGNPHLISGLTPNTTYYYYVQANCGGDVSEWSAKGTFTTECDVNTPPFSEDFSVFPPECWTRFAGTLADPTVVGTSTAWIVGGFANVGTTGAAKLNIYGTSRKEWLVSPSIDLGDGSASYLLSFDLALTKYNSTSSAVTTGTDDKFAVVISTDNGATWSSTNALRLWDNAGSSYVFNNIATTGESVIIDLSGRTGTVKIGFYGESTIYNADNDLFIDNFAVRSLSNENDIISFSFAEQTGPAVIDNSAKTVEIEVLMNTVLTALTPTIAISNYASITPASGTAQDFSVPFEYTVTSELGTPQIWTVTVTESTTQSSEKDILTFALPGQTGPATIGANTIDIEVGWLSNLSSLIPTVTISDFATVSPLSGVAQDFSSPVSYTVTAEDGTTKVYTVSVTLAGAPLGANCTNPFIVSIPTALPYEDLSQTNCGLGNVYQLVDQNYTKGEDAIYRLDVTSNTVVKITMTSVTTWTGLFLFDGCPDTGAILQSATSSNSSPRVITKALTAGTYYVMIDTYASPDCIPAYDLTIETVCPAVTAIQTVNLTATSTDLQWTAGGFETAWNVKVNATSTIDPLLVDGDIVPNASVSVAAYSIASGLNPETTYHVYVQSNCGSDWTHFSFTTPSACPVPTGIATSDITANSATLSWNELGVSDWLIKVSTTSLTDPEAETADFANNTAVSGTGTFGLTGLSANTTYYWYVKSACGSAWSTEGEFTTECSAFSVPFAENFDTWGTGTGAFPDCWKRPVMYSGYSADFPSIVSANSVSSPNSLRFQSLTTEPTYAITPAFAEDIHDLMVTFSLRREGENSGSIVVGIMSNPNDPNTFEPVQTITPTDNVHNLYDVMFDATLLSGANNYIAFKHVSLSSSYYYWLDDVAVDLIPSCPKPKDLFVDNLTATSASLNWTEMGTTTAWNLKVSTSATFDPTIETADIYDGVADGNPHSLTGLAENTTYYWYVQADCGGGDLSDWSVQSMFSTPCLAISAFPFYEGFESGYANQTAVGGCWLQESISGTEVWTANSSLTTYNRTPRTGNFNAYLQYGNEDWMYYAFDLTAGVSYKVDLYARQDVTTGANITVSYGTNPASASMTNPIIPQTEVTDGDYQLLTGNFTPASSDTYYIGIKGELSYTPYYLSIDDFTVDLLPEINQIDINSDVADASVCQGDDEATAIAALAPQITITDTEDAEHIVNLTWSIDAYDASTPAVYAATGTFELPDGVQQTNPATVLEVTTTVTVNAPIEPTFVFTTEYCLGDVANALPTTSENMYTGTWSPAVIATDVAGDADYVFTADAGQCATSPSVTVTINAPIEPAFSFDTEYCLGDVVSALPTTSNNDYTGSWIPAIVATDVAVADVDYVFTADAGQCATNATVPVTVHALPELTCQSDFSVTNVNPVTLNSTPAGGTYTGTGITLAGKFSANGLVNDDYTITYTYTHPTTGCTNFCEFVVTTMVPLGAIAGIDINNVVEDVVVCEGTDEAAVLAMLVDSITIADGQANEYVVGVNWTIDSYDGNAAGNYDATGIFELPMEVGQTDPVTALEVTAIITVNAPVLPTFSFDTEYCLNGLTDPLPIVSDNGYTGTWNVSIIATDVAGDVDYVFTVDPNQCATNASIPVTVHALPVVECPVSFTVTDVNPVNLTATPVGGIYSGAGITEDVFSANGMVNGEYFIAYDYTDPITGCSNFCEFAINIVFPAISDIDVNNDVVDVNVCQGDDEATAIAALVSEITIMDANDVEHVVDVVWTIDAYDANTPADYNATGTFELPAGVLQTDPATTLEVAAIVTVNAPIEPTFVFNTEYCLNDVADVLPLTSENMYTGTWNPAVIATDVTGDVDYVFTADAGQCATNPIITVTVNDPVVPTFDFATEYCLNDVADELPTTSENGITGTWVPAVIATDVAGDVDYVFTADAGQCATGTSISVTVNDPVVPTFDLATEFCLNDVADALPLTSENGITGTWVPAAIATDVAGDVDYVFTADAGQCATATSVTVTVNDPVEPTFVFNTEYCLNDVADELPLVSENGYTGVWDVSEIATDVVGDVNYVFIADAGQCATSPSVTVTVNALPEVTCPDDFTVAGIDVVTLTGTPAGGTFEGPGVTDNMFTAIDLVDGDYIITYTYTDATTGCSNTCEFTVTVDFTSSIGVNEIAKIGVYPNPNNGMFTISFANVDGKANYQIYDAKGSIIVDKNIHTSGDTTEDVSLSLVPGVYFIKVVTANQTIVEKLVIQ